MKKTILISLLINGVNRKERIKYSKRRRQKNGKRRREK
jgi:hypothetical protein